MMVAVSRQSGEPGREPHGGDAGLVELRDGESDNDGRTDRRTDRLTGLDRAIRAAS